MRREAISATILNFPSTWKRFQTANINLKKISPFHRAKIPKINPVTRSRCFLSLAGKVLHDMTITMINQLLFRNLKIVLHLS